MPKQFPLSLALDVENLLGTLQRRYPDDTEVSAALDEAQRLVDTLRVAARHTTHGFFVTEVAKAS